jgi:hypothetical protein
MENYEIQLENYTIELEDTEYRWKFYSTNGNRKFKWRIIQYKWKV